LALLAGLVYASAEYARQLAVPSPPGVPGDSGASLDLLVALGVVVALGPALLFAALPIRERLAEWLSLSVGAWFFGTAGLWRALDRAGYLLERESWTPERFLLPGLLLAMVVAVGGMRLARWWPARLRMSRRVLLLVVVFAVIGLRVGLREPRDPGGGAGTGPNVLLVTVDTLRPDALGSYGGGVPTALDSLGGVPHQGWAASSWTQPSMASLFSSLIPTGHGSDRSHGPDPAVDWWPESMQVAGFRTAAFVTNPYLRRRFGFDRGFERFDHCEERTWLEPIARTVLAEWTQAWLSARPDADRADRVVGRAEQWLAERGGEGPWFLWVHLLDPHLPYTPRGAEGRPLPEGSPDWLSALEGVMSDRGFDALQQIRDGILALDATQRDALRRLYQSEVEFAAWWAARLVRAASGASSGRGLVWVVTSDHGEEFFEEGGFEHGHSLGDPVLRIPMLASGLGFEPVAYRLIDLGPRILNAAVPGGSEFDPRRGAQLSESDAALEDFALPRLPAVAPCSRPPLLAEGLLYGPERTRVFLPDGSVAERDDASGIVHDLSTCATTDGPGQEFPWRLLDLWRERRAVSPLDIELDDDLRRRLRALGYVN
jgi:hypothetical protein